MGSICLKRSSIHKADHQYPIIKKIQKISPNRQNVLEKPFIHFELIDDAQELTQLEGILENLEVNKKITEDKVLTDDLTVQKEQASQHIAIAMNEVIQRLNEVVTQIKFQVELQAKSSVILRTNHKGSDISTIKSILKTNKSKSKSSYSVNRLKQTKTQKKVSFEPKLIKHKVNTIYT